VYCRHPELIRTIALEKNVGLAEAMRLGETECKCEWIARMDAEDVADSR